MKAFRLIYLANEPTIIADMVEETENWLSMIFGKKAPKPDRIIDWHDSSKQIKMNGRFVSKSLIAFGSSFKL